MDELDALIGLLPPEVALWTGNLLVLAISLRTLLLFTEAAFTWLDVRIDGESNWKWVGRIGDAARFLDGIVETLFHVKGIFLRREAGKVVVRGIRRRP